MKKLTEFVLSVHHQTFLHQALGLKKYLKYGETI
jgi:hypothetical protein